MTRDEALGELRAIRLRMDQIAAVLTGEAEREELLPVWDCGHRHSSRAEAIRCKAGLSESGQDAPDRRV
ncbi:MAG TPA: hypothetical protein VFW46_20185 [Stellaceae bacterium]|nr:hypothetical protein [Stellaceae bacterium]